MKLIATHNGQTFEIIEDLPGVGFYIYAYDSNGKNTHDYLQDELQTAKDFALETFDVPLNSWQNDEEVMCCFCGEGLYFSDAFHLSIRTVQSYDETQTIFSHKQCLDKQLHPSVARHPELLD